MYLLGSHVGMSGKDMMLNSVKEALSYGANTFMVYTGAPQNTRRKKVEELNIEAAKKCMEENGIKTFVVHAPYIINLANLKGHSYGITLCGKNHFGSFINGNEMRPPEGTNLHQFLTMDKMKVYSPLVDLMANYELGNKTVLYMLDALICSPSEGDDITGSNSKWKQSPFNGDYTSSIFVSQDPVAIDSVGADFLMNEPAVTNNNSSPKNNATVENYLHEAALVKKAPSGNIYRNGNGKKVTNLGVHEHWNNPVSKTAGRISGIALLYRYSAPRYKLRPPEVLHPICKRYNLFPCHTFFVLRTVLPASRPM